MRFDFNVVYHFRNFFHMWIFGKGSVFDENLKEFRNVEFGMWNADTLGYNGRTDGADSADGHRFFEF